MTTFAKDTSVSVEKSKAEIESLINRYGASSFVSGWQGNKAVIMFEHRDRRIRFTLALPDRGEKRFKLTPSGKHARTDADAFKAWEQECRSLWRSLALVVKAKLEAVSSGIVTFEQEFLPYIVMANGQTVAEGMLPQLEGVISTGRMPPLLVGPSSTQNGS